jgi:hypothetical protein
MRKPIAHKTPTEKVSGWASQVEVLDKSIDLIDQGSDPRQTCIMFRNNAAYSYSTANNGKHGVIGKRV